MAGIPIGPVDAGGSLEEGSVYCPKSVGIVLRPSIGTFGQAGVRGGQRIAALPREERANQQSSMSFHVLTLASKYFNSHLTCMALTWLFQSRRPIPSDAPPLGVSGAVWFLIHLYELESVPKCSASKVGSLSQRSWYTSACSAWWNHPGAAMVCTQYLGTEKIMKFASRALPIIDRNLSCFQLAMRRSIFRYRVSQKASFSPVDQ
eukprot:scaffold6296_cov124-Isochrysis_galbana.AAC.8